MPVEEFALRERASQASVNVFGNLLVEVTAAGAEHHQQLLLAGVVVEGANHRRRHLSPRADGDRTVAFSHQFPDPLSWLSFAPSQHLYCLGTRLIARGRGLAYPYTEEPRVCSFCPRNNSGTAGVNHPRPIES